MYNELRKSQRYVYASELLFLIPIAVWLKSLVVRALARLEIFLLVLVDPDYPEQCVRFFGFGRNKQLALTVGAS